jgi:hypothetical protein
MISALIITKDAYERVLNLTKLLDPYVDEIVIFHSADSRSKHYVDFWKLADNYPKVFVYNDFEEGFVEAYYEIGISLCSNDWVLLLDDDEIPSQRLLEDLDNLTCNEPTTFFFRRIEPNDQTTNVVRLFHKDSVVVTGLIHRGIDPIGSPTQLDDRSFIIHNSSHSKEKCQKFAAIEAKQYPEIIAYVAKKHKYIQYAYFLVSSLPRVILAPNKKDQLIYLKYLWKELRK